MLDNKKQVNKMLQTPYFFLAHSFTPPARRNVISALQTLLPRLCSASGNSSPARIIKLHHANTRPAVQVRLLVFSPISTFVAMGKKNEKKAQSG